MTATTTHTSLVSTMVQQERRAGLRMAIAKPVLACPFGPECTEEVQTTSNISSDGLYFETPSNHYRKGMPISVVVGYGSDNRFHPPSFGRVARVDRLKNGHFGIAIQILMR
jgi:hypothetical protein